MNANEEVLELDMTPLTIPVRLRMNGKWCLFEIRDITGLQRDRFLTQQNAKMGKTSRSADLTGYQSSLIALCLWDLRQEVVKEEYEEGGQVLTRERFVPVDDPPKPATQIPQEVIDRWPARVQSLLNKHCERVSGLEAPAAGETEQAAKNG